MKKYLSKVILSFLFAAAALAILPYMPVNAATNPVINGSFEYGWEGWDTYFNERYSGKGEVTKDCRAAIDISFFVNFYGADGTDYGPVDWSAQLTQNGINVERSRNYKLKFTASSTVKRPIALTMKTGDYTKKEHFLLDTKEQTYEMDYTTRDTYLDIAFMMGQFSSEQYPDYPYTSNECTKHTIYISDVRLILAGSTEDEKPAPRVIGIEDGASYYSPVYAKVNYRNKPYTLEMVKDGKKIDYKEGAQIWEDGDYTLTVTDSTNPSARTVMHFTIKLGIDFNKKWVVIANKSTEKVMEAGGSSGKSVMQGTYKGKASQFFVIEETSSGYVKIRSMSSGYLVGITVQGKLELAADSGTDRQLWQIDTSVPQGYVKFINKNSQKAIEIGGALKTEGQILSMADKSSNDDEGQESADPQRWDIIHTIDAKEAIQGKAKPDVSTPAKWAADAVITPVINGLNPAGALTVEFYPLEGAGSYDIYFDGEKTASVTKAQLESASVKDNYMLTEDGTIKLFRAAYSTKVSKHTLYIQADTGTKTNTMEFYLTKKGACWGTLHRIADMDISWYYHWATDEALGTDEYLEFVPMMWGNYGDEWLKDASNKKYGTILSFNEPDWSDQSNVPVTIEDAIAWTSRYNNAHGTNIERPSTIEEVWQSFMDSGLRVGSPSTAIAPPYCDGRVTMNNVDGPDTWWYDFMDLMKKNSPSGWDYDFVAVHSYDGGCDAKGFLEMVDKTHELTGKPIWITEFGVAEWGSKQWQGGNAATIGKVRDFMAEVIQGLEERDFVERYAWFPFNPDDEYGGASGIFNYSTGELTELGKLYKSLGVPQGYDPDKKGDNSNNNPGNNGDNNNNGNNNSNNNNDNNNNNNNNSNNNNNNNSNNNQGNNNNNNQGNGNNNQGGQNSNNGGNIYYINSITDRTERLMDMLQGYISRLSAIQNENKKKDFDSLMDYMDKTKKQVDESNAKMEDTLAKLQEAALAWIKMENNNKK